MPEQSLPHPRLNWFCSLPEMNTGSANAGLENLIALGRQADVVVWTDPSYPATTLGGCAVRRWNGKAWMALNSGDATVYQATGDGKLPDWIWHVARLHAGVLVIDELSPADTRRSASPTAEHPPLNVLHLARARGVIVHTAAAFREASALGRCAVIQLDRGDADTYAQELIAAVTTMQRNASSVLHGLCITTGRILSESNMDPSARRYLADRAARELCRWTAVR
jgi:hypothetical protein